MSNTVKWCAIFCSMSTIFERAKRRHCQQPFTVQHSGLPKYSYFLRILANFGFSLNFSLVCISNHRKSTQYFGLPVRQPRLYFAEFWFCSHTQHKCFWQKEALFKSHANDHCFAGVNPSLDQHICFQLCCPCYDLLNSGYSVLEWLNLSFKKGLLERLER